MDLAWWQVLIGALVGLVILVILVVIHELGHAIAAVRNGVKVEEFGIGFPPLAKKLGKYKGTLITLNWLPLGGFCKLKGESDDAKGKGTFGAASFWSKTKILLAGVFMNFLAAVVIFTILAFFGIPQIVPGQFQVSADNSGKRGIVVAHKVIKNSPADKAGIKSGDEIERIAGSRIMVASQVSDLTSKYAGKEVKIGVKHQDQPYKIIKVKLNDRHNSDKGFLGLQAEQKQGATIKATWSAPLVGLVNVLQFMWLTITSLIGIIGNLFVGFFDLITLRPEASSNFNAVGESVAGPIGILGNIFPSAVFAGATTLLYISGIIALSLTVMNLLTIPGLDGGRWLLIAVYHLLGKKLTKDKEEKVVGYGMLVLFGLIIVITVADILKLFR